MAFGRKPRGRLPWIRGLIALSLAAAPVMLSSGPANAQVAVLGLRKAVSLPPPSEVAPATPFTYFLSYSCSSLSQDCHGAVITDVIPAELSRQVADVKLAGNFASATYDAATGTARFVLFDPVAAGTTAQVAISAQFPPGTPVGTQAVNQGTITATNASPVTSNQVIVTAKAASKWTVTKNVVPAGAPPQVDTPYTYRVGITLAAGGTQNLNGVVFTDTLPTGAQFVSATGGGTFAAGVVTWPPRDLVPNPNADVSSFEQVTVIFPSASFPVGTKILNLVVANGTPAGEPVQELGRATRPGTIAGAGTVTAGSKRDTLPELGPGQSDTYTITAENPNVTPLAGFHVVETLPPQLEMVQDGNPNLSGAGPPPVSITATPGGNVPISGGGPWTATAPDGQPAVRLRDRAPELQDHHPGARRDPRQRRGPQRSTDHGRPVDPELHRDLGHGDHREPASVHDADDRPRERRVQQGADVRIGHRARRHHLLEHRSRRAGDVGR
jgi:uncharacterized repeat protein (TIGR01451 family)